MEAVAEELVVNLRCCYGCGAAPSRAELAAAAALMMSLVLPFRMLLWIRTSCLCLGDNPGALPVNLQN